MSADKIRNALALLKEDADNADTWSAIEDVVTSADSSEVERWLEMARGQHEAMRDWWVVTKLLSFEIDLANDDAITAAKQLEQARIYYEELAATEQALAAYEKVLELREGDATAKEALAQIRRAQAAWEGTVGKCLAEANAAEEPALKSRMLVSAADAVYRYGGHSEESLTRAAELLEQALELSPTSRRALDLAELLYISVEYWEQVSAILRTKATSATVKDEKIAAALRLGRLCRSKLDDTEGAIAAFRLILDVDPSHAEALSFLVDHFSDNEQWDQLVALYEDQLNAGGVKAADELGVWVQIAMLNWKTRKLPEQALPYFERVRRVDPSHAGMLNFFREHYRETGETTRLVSILADAEKALDDEAQKQAIATEIVSLAEDQETAKRAIDEYKNQLRADPNNEEARLRLKKLYLQTESYNALVELLRQELQRTAKEDTLGRIAVLREIAKIYGERLKSDTALLTVLTQILQLDESDIDAVRQLTNVYESLSRWRDLLNTQQRLAELTENTAEKINLLRAVARRWLDQFSNVQNAMSAYEALLAVSPDDAEAREKLVDLYQKRRAWPKLYELYDTQLDELRGEARVELMMEMAKLAAERLDRGNDAIRLLKEVLVFDPNAEGVLDALERQGERQKDYQTVAHVLERRVDDAEDDKAKLALLQKLGALYADRLEDVEAANRAWQRVLEVSPGHKRALRVLRQSYVSSADWDGLEELYKSQQDHEGLADFLSTTADRVEDDEQKVEVSFRAARVYEQELGTPERAARSYERILSIDQENVQAARALLPLYEQDEKWSRLPGLYTIILDATEDVEQKIEILHKVADITGGPLANKSAALGYARKAYELRPDEQGLVRLQEWSTQSGEWSAFIEVVQARLQDTSELSDERVRELRLMLAQVYAQEEGKIDEAVTIYRSLVEADPTDHETVTALEELLRSADRRDDLRWLFELKAERFEGDQRSETIEEWALVEEEVFGEPEKAIALLQRVVAEDPERKSALGTLTRLLLSSQQFEAAAKTMQAHRDAAEGEERVELETKLAHLYLTELKQPIEAYNACIRALAIVEDHQATIKLLEQLLEIEETRGDAAATLEKIYSSADRPRKQAVALRAMLEQEEDPQRRLELCQRLAEVQERDLADPASAFDVLLKTLLEFPGDMQLWERVGELAAAAGKPNELAQAYRQHLMAAAEPEGEEARQDISPEVQIELCERAAVLHEDQLGDAEGAIPYLERMLELEPSNERAFERLKQILNAVERWQELEELFGMAVKVSEDPTAKVQLLSEVALVAEEMMEDNDKAITYYESILEIDESHKEAAASLEKLYGREERYEKLAALLEKRLEITDAAEAPPIQLQLVELYLRSLNQPDKVMNHLEAVLQVNPSDTEARELAEECLEVKALRQQAAALLDTVYEGLDKIRDLVRVLEVRLEGAQSDEDKRTLLHRIATLRDDRLKDDAGAFESLRVLMPLEPDDASIRQRLLEVGNRLGEHEKMARALLQTAEATAVPSNRGEILMEAAALFREQLEATAQSEKVYRQVLEIDPDEPTLVIPAARALAEIYDERGRHDELANALNTQVRLVEDPAERAEIYERIANLYEEILEDNGKAIEAWKARLSDNLSDVIALKSLERLYEQTKAWKSLVEVLNQLEQAGGESSERKRCMVKSAEVLAGELDETGDAINAWRAVLDDFGPEPETLAALSKLYQKAERWEDLAEILVVWLSLTDDLDERVELYASLGDVRRMHLSEPRGALEAYREVLLLDPSHSGSREALEAMLEIEDPEIKREAAEILGPLYEADGNAERLLTVLNIEIEATFEPTSKLQKLETALRTAEDTLQDPKRAFDYAARGVREAIGEPTLSEWIDVVERLAAETERWSDLMDLFESVVGEMLDAEVQQRTRLRAGELARTMLEDDARAIVHFKAALQEQADDQRAMVALEELYEATDDAPALLEILQLRAESVESERERIALLYRIAKLQAGPLGDPTSAIDTYEDVLELALEDDAVEALEELYAKADRYDALVGLYERQLEADVGGSAADLRVKIAEVANDKLKDTSRALDELGEALNISPMHSTAIKLLEAILEKAEEPDHRAQVAEMLEPVYLGKAEWGRLKLVYEARLETSQDLSERADLLRRLATLYEEQLEDYDAALETTAKLLREDPGDEEIWSEIERLGRVLGTEERLAEIFAGALEEVGSDDPKTAILCRRTGELFAIVERYEDALKWYRRSHEFSPESTELFEAIDGLLVELKRPQERVEHYRALLDHVFEDEPRIEALHTIAKLQRDDLEQPDDAAMTLREVLDIDEANDQALDALTELYKSAEKWLDLAELYERRADLYAEPEQAAPYRLALARLWIKDPVERDRAIDQLQLIVDELPLHEAAVRELEGLLEDEERKPRVLDMLEPLYKHAENWEGLIKLHELRLTLLDDPHNKVEVMTEIAMLWEDHVGDQEKAFDVIRQAFELLPGEESTRATLERLAESLDAWEELAESYEGAADSIDDEYVKRQLLDALATVADEELDDPRRALAALSKLSEIDPGDSDLLERMDTLCVLLSDWETLVKVLTRQADNTLEEAEAARLWRRVGALKKDMLLDEKGAVEVYERALELQPESADTLDRLIGLYEARQDATRLVELLERRVEITGVDDPEEEQLRHELIVRCAQTFEEKLSNRGEAIRLWAMALDTRPEDQDVLVALARLYEAEEMYDALLENLKTQAELAEELDHRIALRNRIGDLYISQFENVFDAVEQYRLVLGEAPANEHAISSARKIGEENEELRLEVSALLEPVLLEAGRYAELCEVIELRFSAQGDPTERADTLKSMARILEEQLAKPVEARDALLRAVEEAPGDTELHDDIGRLCEATEDYTKYADVLEAQASNVFDGVVATELFSRLGEIAEEKLGQAERAIGAYKRASEQASPERLPALLEALDRLYEGTKSSEELAKVLERRVDIEQDPEERADLYHRLAVLQIHEFDDKISGLGTLRMVVDLVPQHSGARKELEVLTDQEELFEEAAEALETIYRVSDDSKARAQLRNKRIGYAPTAADRVQLRLELAQMLEEESFDTTSAQTVIEEALADDINSFEVLAQLERLAAVNAEADENTGPWRRAAQAVIKAVTAAVTADREGTGDGSATPERARDLYLHGAGWYLEHVEDDEAAEAALKLALEHDPRSPVALTQLEELQRVEGREADLVVTLRRLAELAQGQELEGNPADLRREAKELAETALNDPDLAEEILREMLQSDDGDRWALTQLCQVCERKQAHQELYDLLIRRVELAEGGEDLRELRHKAAAVAAEKLENFEAAVDLYEQCFEESPRDSVASDALRELYQKLKRFEDMLRFTERLVDLTDNPPARADLRLQAAKICIEILETPSEGIDHLHAVLDEVPGHEGAVMLLSKLLEKEGRDDELAELLTTQIGVAREKGDQSAELGFRVRLSELYESRLNEPDKAIEGYQAVLDTDPNFRPALEALARLYEGQQDNEHAAKMYDKLIDGAGAEDAARLALKACGLYSEIKDSDAACRVLEDVLDRKEDPVAPEKAQELRDKLRTLYRDAGEWKKLADLITDEAESATETGEKVLLYRKAAEIHSEKRDDHNAAAEVLEAALELKSDDRGLMLVLCDEYTASGRGKAAIEVLHKIVESYGGRRSKDLADIHHRIASAYLAEKEEVKALDELEQARKMDPGSVKILFELGHLSIQLADSSEGDDSKEHLKRAANNFRSLLLQRLDDDSPVSKAEVFYYLAEVNKREGEKKKAIQMCERALSNDKDLEKAKELLAELKG